MDGWVTSSCGWFVPLCEAQRQIIQHSSYLMADETPIPVLDRTKPWKTHLGYHGVYYDPVAKRVLFDYRPGRSRAGPNDMLKNFRGHLQIGLMAKLEKYVTDGRLEIDNNLVENAIRPVALGRKNYLFAGSHEGAKRAAMIYTLVATAKLHQVEPFEIKRRAAISPMQH